MRDVDEEAAIETEARKNMASLLLSWMVESLHGQWRGIGNGNHGYCQALRWRNRPTFWILEAAPAQISSCCIADHPLRQKRKSHSVQHLRRHYPL